MKTPTQDDIKTVADDLMVKFSSTTTLDVKNELRSLGYWATQDFVSASMEVIGYNFTNNGTFRVYDNTVVPMPVQSSYNAKPLKSTAIKGAKPILVDNQDGTFTYTKRNGGMINTSDSSYGAYKAYSAVSNVVLYFDRGYGRDEMRYVYKKVTGMKYVDTRVISI